MESKYNKDLVPIAKTLRKNMTKEERHLWYDFLRRYPVKFTRQKVLGRYVADFYCAEAKLIIELDGSQHGKKDNIEKDAIRTEYLSEFGMDVLRLPNQVINKGFDNVCKLIDSTIQNRLEHFGKKR